MALVAAKFNCCCAIGFYLRLSIRQIAFRIVLVLRQWLTGLVVASNASTAGQASSGTPNLRALPGRLFTAARIR